MGTFFHELVHVGVYKRSQGRITRQVTFAALAVTIALGLLQAQRMLMHPRDGRSWSPGLGPTLVLLLLDC